MTSSKIKRPARLLPEIDHPDWAAADSRKHLADVEYVGKLEAIVFKFEDGRIFGVPISELEGLDATPVKRAFVSMHGYEATIEQFSGNVLEVPWDLVLYHADPTYPHRRPEPGSPDEQERLRVDAVIGERIRTERRVRNWTLADLSSRTGIKVPNLSRLERGRHTPSLDTLEKVAEAFGLQVAALIAQRPWAAPGGDF